MKRVLIVFPTDWDLRQLDSCRSRWHRDYEIITTEPCDTDVRAGFDVLEFIARTVDQHRGHIAGVMSSSDYPGATVAGAIATQLDLPGTKPHQVLRCGHKYYSRIAQQEVVPEATPWFQLVDPHRLADAAAKLQFPCFVKPVKGAFSIMSRRLNHAEDLRAFLSDSQVEDFLQDYVRIFNRLVAELTDFEVDGSYFLAEELLHGTQATVEGYVRDGDVQVLGVVESVLHPESISFARFDLPTSLHEEIQQRMIDIARRLVKHLQLNCTLFNIEMFYEPTRDRITIIEINPRICGQFADLYDKVLGGNSYLIALALATGSPVPTPQQPSCQTASSFPLRVFSPLRVHRAPSAEDIAAAEALFPGTLCWSECHSGQELAHFEEEDGASLRYAVINLGAADRTSLLERFDAVRARLGFEFEPL